MSISSYYAPRLSRELKMPKTDGEVPSPCGISWQGPVGQGRMSVTEAFVRASMGKPHDLPSPQRRRDEGGRR